MPVEAVIWLWLCMLAGASSGLDETGRRRREQMEASKGSLSGS
jgi:hypothetical protein